MTDLQYSLLRQQLVSLLRKDPPLPEAESKSVVIKMFSEVDGASGQFGPNLVFEVPPLACTAMMCSVDFLHSFEDDFEATFRFPATALATLLVPRRSCHTGIHCWS